MYVCVHLGWPELQTPPPLVEVPSRANGVQSPPPQTLSQNWGADEGGKWEGPYDEGGWHSTDEPLHTDGGQPPCNVEDWGPLYGEDEDFKMAIQDSLKDGHSSHVTADSAGAHVWDSHSRRGMLVTGHEGANHQLVGENVLQESMLQFSSTQLHTEIPKTRINQSPSPGHLPSQLQQLLDSSERLGTNV